MNADKIRELVADGRTVVVMLTNATVVSVKSDFIHLRTGHITNLRVRQPLLEWVSQHHVIQTQ